MLALQELTAADERRVLYATYTTVLRVGSYTRRTRNVCGRQEHQ